MQKPVKPPTEEDRDNITLSLKKGYGEISGVSSGAITILFPQPRQTVNGLFQVLDFTLAEAAFNCHGCGERIVSVIPGQA